MKNINRWMQNTDRCVDQNLCPFVVPYGRYTQLPNSTRTPLLPVQCTSIGWTGRLQLTTYASWPKYLGGSIRRKLAVMSTDWSLWLNKPFEHTPKNHKVNIHHVSATYTPPAPCSPGSHRVVARYSRSRFTLRFYHDPTARVLHCCSGGRMGLCPHGSECHQGYRNNSWKVS